jgi:hypothetical protein
MRIDTITRIPALGLVLLVAACASNQPSAPPASSATDPSAPLPAIAQASATAAATATPAPTPTPPPRPTGTLLVWQLDGIIAPPAKTESVFRLDLANGATTPIASIPVNENTCCPTSLTLSKDRGTAFLYAANYRGAVDLATGGFEKASTRIPPGIVAISHGGDRLAWIDDLTGTSESVVIGGRDGKPSKRIALPAGAFASIPAWADDDSTLFVTTLLPVKTASTGIQLASTIACCSIDRGVEATHLLVVPVDGTAIRDIYDDKAGVIADQAQPAATRPPSTTSGYAFQPNRSFRLLGQSPDGQTLLADEDICPGRWGTFRDGVQACRSELMTIDTETAVRTPLPVPPTMISSAGWSPDGRRLSLLGSGGGGPTGSQTLYLLDRDGGSIEKIGPAEPELMSWSSDGKWLAFWRLDPEVTDGDQVQVWVVSTTGGEPRFVAAHATVGWLEP